MKKIISLIVLSIFFFNFSYAEKYWSNKKDGTTNVGAAVYIFESERREYSFKETLPLHGIWYSPFLGFVIISPISNDYTSYKIRLIKPPRGWTSKQKKSFIHHGGTVEGTIISIKDRPNEFIYYSKVWYEQPDDSYKYKTKKIRLKIKGENHFTLIDKEEATDDDYLTFIRIYPNKTYDIKEYLQTHSRGLADYDYYTDENGILSIRLNDENVRRDKKGKNKFIRINPNGNVSAGVYTWDQEDLSKSKSDTIICYKKRGLYRNYFNKIKSYCDPKKVTYTTYLYYKYRFIFVFGVVFFGVIIFYRVQFVRNRNELNNFNKKNNKKFKTYFELKEFKQKIQEKERKVQIEIRKAQEEKDLKEQKRLEAAEKRKEQLEKKSQSVSVDEGNNDNLMGKIKRLKTLYKNGTLTKAEFEKAKNKLLK